LEFLEIVYHHYTESERKFNASDQALRLALSAAETVKIPMCIDFSGKMCIIIGVYICFCRIAWPATAGEKTHPV
jgi:hypothetical protein